MREYVDEDLEDSFAPIQPLDWIKNPVEWLSNEDILKVMTQYEKSYTDFEFLGPSPIDYREKVSYFRDTCVWEELCRFNLSSMMKKGKTKFGIVFNLDKHDMPGSHWVAMYIDVKKRGIYYFDSTGEAMPKYLEQLVKSIKDQGHRSYINFHFQQNHPKEHQKGGTECGIYVLYFIVNMIHTGNFKKFNSKNTTIPDNMMKNLRNHFFNKNKTS